MSDDTQDRNVVLIIMDSLRWDFARPALRGVFDEYEDYDWDETWTQLKTPETFTAPCVSTILTGLDPKDHGIHTWNDSPLTVEDNVANKYDGDMYTPVFSGGDDMCVVDVPSINVEGMTKYSGDESEVFEWFTQDSFASFGGDGDDDGNFLIYHSFITHEPWGLECRCVPDEESPWTFFHNEGNYTDDNYVMGVEDMRTRIRKMMDEYLNEEDVLICVSDHGEALGEHGLQAHGRLRTINGVEFTESLERFWATAETPMIVNRDIDVPKTMPLRDVRCVVEYFLGDYDEIPWDLEVETPDDIETRHPADRDLGEEDKIDEDVQDRLEDLGYM